MSNQAQTMPPLINYALILLAFAFLIMCFGRGFIDPDEGRYAEVPRAMVASGNWLEMRLMTYRYYEKPPLAYWLTAPAIALCGARDWAARIPLFFNAIAVWLLCLALMRRHWPRTQARWSLLVAASTTGFMAGLTLLMTDPFLTMWFLLTCLLGHAWFGAPAGCPRRCWLAAGAGTAAALGFLTKGALAVALPGAIFVIWMTWTRRWRDLRWSLPLTAGAVFIAIVTPVLWMIEQHNPGFFFHFIIEEHFARFTGTRELQGHPKSPWFYTYVTPLLLAPWSLFLFRAVRTIFKQKVFRHDELSRFMLVWAGVVLVFFSISTGKLMSYILPAMPPLALLLARWGVVAPHDGTAADRRLIGLGLAGTILLMIGLAGAWIISVFNWLPDDLYPARPISLLAFLPIVLTLPALRGLTAGNFLPRAVLLNAGVLLTVALLLSPLPGRDFNVRIHQNSSRAYMELARHLNPEDRVVTIWAYRPALPFYTQRDYRPFQDTNELIYGMRLEPERPPEMRHPDELRQLIAGSSGRVFAVLEPFYYPDRFNELNINYRPAGLQGDRHTMILELLP